VALVRGPPLIVPVPYGDERGVKVKLGLHDDIRRRSVAFSRIPGRWVNGIHNCSSCLVNMKLSQETVFVIGVEVGLFVMAVVISYLGFRLC
jgi:hypothetical protein